MNEPNEQAVLRTRDFWSALVLIALSVFFLWRTSHIQMFGANRAGVNGADWFNSAAVVPLAIFSAMLVLSVVLLVIAIRAGAAAGALRAAGIGWDRLDGLRFATLAIVLFFYIVGLVPRVDFIICSGLVITALIFGYYGGHGARMVLAAICLALAGGYAMAQHLPQAQWRAWDDDILALIVWGGLTLYLLARDGRNRVLRLVPVIAVLVPLILVTAMAFGFRQNVPNRGGLIFSQIEYHYYVTLRPLWRD